jgi:hypothetical protein
MVLSDTSCNKAGTQSGVLVLATPKEMRKSDFHKKRPDGAKKTPTGRYDPWMIN